MAKKIKISQLEEAKTLDGLWIFGKAAGAKNVRASMGLLRGNTAFVEWQGRNPGKTYADWIRLLQDPAFTAAEGVDLIKKNLTDFEAAAKEKEAARVQAETSRGTAEANRVEAENKRVTSESGRVTAESARDAAEKDRITKETARVKAETSRGTAETARAKAETERVTSFNTIKTDAETATSNATSAAEKGELLNNNPPKVVDDHWHAYDLEQKKYVNTNVKARGEQGYDLIVLSNGNYGNYNRVTGKYDDSGVKASATVDIENVTVRFTEAAKKENITTGETIPVMLGKIRKWFSDGIGNVLASTTGLKKDARYLFSPKADGSSEGAFVEYVEPVVGITNLLNGTSSEWKELATISNSPYREIFFKNTILEPNQTYTFSWDAEPVEGEAGGFVNIGSGTTRYSNDMFYTKLPIIGRHSFTFTPTENQLKTHKSFAFRWYNGLYEFKFRYRNLKLVKGNTPTDFTLSPEDQKAEIEAQITSKGYQTANDVNESIAAFSEINLIPAFTDPRWFIHQRATILNDYSLVHIGNTGQGYTMRSHITVSIEPDTSYTLSLKKTGTPDPTIVVSLISDQSSQSTVFADYKTEELVRTFKTEKNSVGILIELGGNSLPSTDGLFFSLLSLKKGTSGVWSPSFEDFKAYESFATGSNTITTLSAIPTTKRIILATLSAAANITLKEPLDVGKELLISINPTADFEQPLPVSGGWQSLDGDTLSIKANKPAELSILCVGDNKYVLSSKVAE